MNKTASILLIIIAFTMFGCLVAAAQTNMPAATVAGAAVTAASDTTAADIAKVLQDFGIHINVTSLLSIYAALYFLAKLIRNKTALGKTPFGDLLARWINFEASRGASKPPGAGGAAGVILILAILWGSIGPAVAQETNEIFINEFRVMRATNVVVMPHVIYPTETRVDKIIRDIGSPTNYAIEPYFTYAPKAPAKYGGGLLGIWDVSEHVGLGAGLDWLGHLSLLSVDASLQAPFHPAPNRFPDLIVSPFLLGGIATAYGGAGNFNGDVSTVQDIGGFIRVGRLYGGQFNAGVAWGQWTGLGPYDVKRYHVFAGYSHGF